MTDTEKRYKELLKRCYDNRIIYPVPTIVKYLNDDSMEWESIKHLYHDRNLKTYISIQHFNIFDYIYEGKRLSQISVKELLEFVDQEDDSYISSILRNKICTRQREDFSSAYPEYNRLDTSNKRLIDTIDINSMPNIHFREGVCPSLIGKIKDDIIDIVKLCNRNYNEILLNDVIYITTPSGAKRSAMDIYLLLKYYDATYTLKEVIDALEELVQEKTLSTWICGGIGRRVYWIRHDGDSHTWDNGEDLDEFYNYL